MKDVVTNKIHKCFSGFEIFDFFYYVIDARKKHSDASLQVVEVKIDGY